MLSFPKYSRSTAEYHHPEKADKGCRRGIATHGISYTYTMEALRGKSAPKVFKVSTPFPFPEQAAVKFLEGLDEVLCIEELDPIIERELTYICGKYHLPTKILGKLTHNVKTAGENTCASVAANIADFMGWEKPAATETEAPPALPVRPPVLCAGCPHRASFFAVKEAMKGKNPYSAAISAATLSEMPCPLIWWIPASAWAQA